MHLHRHVPEPEALPVTGLGVPPPIVHGGGPGPVPPAPAPSGSGSVRAADGSTIAWTTAANGTVTANGTAGRQMVMQPTGSVAASAVRMAFSAASQGTYLSINRSINQSGNLASVEIAGGGSQITLTITLSGSSTGSATASGSFGTTPFHWSGQISLSTNPMTVLAHIAGFNASAFNSQIAEASYFAPACKILAENPSGPPVTGGPAPVVHPLTEGWGEFLSKAAVWGLAAVAGTVLTAGTGGLDLLVLTGVFLTGADASMITDDITIYSSLPSGDPGTGDGGTGDGGTGTGSGDGGTGSGGTGTGSGDGGTGSGDGGTGSGDGGTGTGDGGTGSGGDGGGGGGGCFAAGTLVVTKDGRSRPIEEFRVDDLLASRDELTRADGARRVSRTWTHHGKQTVDVRLENGETIRATSVHRVFTADRGVIDVAELKVGDLVQTLCGGPQAIQDITPGPSSVTVHNLTVDGYHTYFVGAVGMWVHNEKKVDGGDGGEGDGGDNDG